MSAIPFPPSFFDTLGEDSIVEILLRADVNDIESLAASNGVVQKVVEKRSDLWRAILFGDLEHPFPRSSDAKYVNLTDHGEWEDLLARVKKLARKGGPIPYGSWADLYKFRAIERVFSPVADVDVYVACQGSGDSSVRDLANLGNETIHLGERLDVLQSEMWYGEQSTLIPMHFPRNKNNPDEVRPTAHTSTTTLDFTLGVTLFAGMYYRRGEFEPREEREEVTSKDLLPFFSTSQRKLSSDNFTVSIRDEWEDQKHFIRQTVTGHVATGEGVSVSISTRLPRGARFVEKDALVRTIPLRLGSVYLTDRVAVIPYHVLTHLHGRSIALDTIQKTEGIIRSKREKEVKLPAATDEISIGSTVYIPRERFEGGFVL